MKNKEKFDHKHYTHCSEKEADGIAYAFVSKTKMVKFPYKCEKLSPDEIRANVLYAGLCHSDVMTVRENWGPCNYPMAPGHEIIAQVIEYGSNVKGFNKGEIVAFGTLRTCCEKCEYCKEGRENICMSVPNGKQGTFGEYWGGYSTLIQQPASFFFHLPKNFNIKAGAPLLCAGITTYYPMVKFLKPGMNTAVIGIGGLGHMAVQFLHKMGHHVVAMTHSLDKKDFIKSLGADEIVNTKDKESMKTINRKIDFLINTLPVMDGFETFMEVMKNGGIFVQVGAPDFSKCDGKINSLMMVSREITFVGSAVGPRKITQDMLNFCAEKNIYPIVEEYSFEDFPKAFDKLENGKPHFRCVVNCMDFAKKHGLFKC